MGLKKHSALPLFTAVLLVVFQLATTLIKAEEIVISGNGDGSTNEVTVSNNSTTSVTQTNNADVTNSVDTSANTGGNTASDNTGGDVAVQTGDINQNLTIENSLNSSVVDIPCCPSDPGAEISGNGSESENSITLENQTYTQISITQNAYVTNNVQGSANTGENKANDNTGGDVLIDTGSIFVSGMIKNGPINIYSIEGGNGGGNFTASISSNGTSSTNIISVLFASLANLSVNNNAEVANNVLWDLNTGENEANGNTGGDVTIRTGDIFFNLGIENGPINVGGITWGCCRPHDGDGGGPGDGENPPGSNPGSSSGSSSSSGGGIGAIIGLSDTSSEAAQTLIFWAGLAMMALGTNFAGKELFKKRKSPSFHR